LRSFAVIVFSSFLAHPALSVELFRYRGAAKDGGTLECLCEADAQNSPNAENETARFLEPKLTFSAAIEAN
jgi:hypothetical protein